MLKHMPGLHHFKLRKNKYIGHVIIGENDGNDQWPVPVKIWSEPHERTWRYWYGTQGALITPKNGVAYEATEGFGADFASEAAAYKALREALETVYA